MSTFYLVIDTTISNENLRKIRDEATLEFDKTRHGNDLSIVDNPLDNEAYLKIVTDEAGPYIKQRIKAAMDLGWVKSIHRTNESFKPRLQAYWATLDN